MKKNDRDRLIDFIKYFNLPYDHYNEKEYICSTAIHFGAVETISIRQVLDLAFDKNGKYVGTFTERADSFVNNKGKGVAV